MIVYGRNAVREALRGRRRDRIGRVWATRAALREAWLRPARAEQVAGEDALDHLCGSSEHQGVCADAGEYPYGDADALLAAPEAIVLCLDQVQDPRNLGATCRVAECGGAAGVVVPKRRAAVVTPAVCKASAGAVEHLPVARVQNLTDFLERAKRAGAWIYGAAADAPTGYEVPDYGGRVVVVLGSESSGLRPRVAGACDSLVALPLRGRVESLNVSAAAAVLVYGILRSRARGA